MNLKQLHLVIFGILFVSVASFANQPIFDTWLSYKGSDMLALLAVDLNGDDRPDVVTGNYISQSISVFIRDGNGFLPRIDYSAFSFIFIASLVAADLDGDGHQDIVAGSGDAYSQGAVSVFKNNGDGALAPRVDYFVASGGTGGTVGVNAGDLDNDGDIDLVAVTRGTSSKVSVFMNNGDGTFADRVEYPTGYIPIAVYVSDLNGDGYQDLITANESGYSVSVLTNNGDGTFAFNIDYAVGLFPNSVVAADFDQDGDQDLAVGSRPICVLMNMGDGTFAPKVEYGLGGGSIIASDLDEDGDIDMAVSRGHNNVVHVFANNGDGTFSPSVDYATGPGPSLFASDMDQDGDQDFVVGSHGSKTFSILENLGAGFFRDGRHYTTNPEPAGVLAADFDGDSDLDLAVAASRDNTINVLKNNGNGLFTSKLDFQGGGWPTAIASSDLDADGDLDLVTTNRFAVDGGYPSLPGKTISVSKNNGDGTFATATDYAVGDSGNYPNAVVTSDFDEDGDIDLASVSAYDPVVSILMNNGNGTFAPRVTYETVPLPTSVTTADFDLDGDVDLAVARYPDTVCVLMNNGDGTFAPKVDYLGGAIVSAAELDGDGYSELVSVQEGVVSVLKNNGDGTFSPPTQYLNGGIGKIFISDIDGDGDRDIVTPNAGNTVSILLNNGNGTFYDEGSRYGAGSSIHSLFAADLDGDGDQDLAITNPVEDLGFISVLNNLSNSPFPPFSRGDLNGDGNRTVADVVLMINCVFLMSGNCELSYTDVNCDNSLSASDIVIELYAIFLARPITCF